MGSSLSTIEVLVEERNWVVANSVISIREKLGSSLSTIEVLVIERNWVAVSLQ